MSDPTDIVVVNYSEKTNTMNWIETLTNTDNCAHLDLDTLEAFSGYGGGDFIHEVGMVAAVLSATFTTPAFMFGYDADVDGMLNGYTLSVLLPHTPEFTEFHDYRNATLDRDATGIAAATAIADALYGDYLRMATTATTFGLLAPKPTTHPVDMVTAAAHLDEDGNYNSTIAIPMSELLEHDSGETACANGYSRADYLAETQVENAVAFMVGYTIHRVEGDDFIVTVSNNIGEMLAHDNIDPADAKAVAARYGVK